MKNDPPSLAYLIHNVPMRFCWRLHSGTIYTFLVPYWMQFILFLLCGKWERHVVWEVLWEVKWMFLRWSVLEVWLECHKWIELGMKRCVSEYWDSLGIWKDCQKGILWPIYGQKGIDGRITTPPLRREKVMVYYYIVNEKFTRCCKNKNK